MTETRTMDDVVECPIEATYIALLHNVDGENAHTFSQQMNVIAQESMGFKAEFIINSIERNAREKGIPQEADWANKMKAFNFKNGFIATLNSFLIPEMVRLRYPL